MITNNPPIGSIRLSHSTIELINTCERKFQLDKLLTAGYRSDDTADTVFGKAYGVGVATYLVTQNKEEAIYKTWLAYMPVIETDKKNTIKCLNALMASFHVLDNILEEYEVVYFNNKPAVEMSFCIHTDTKYYYVGYLDVVLKHILTGKYVVADAKTTGLEIQDLAPVYKNSSQLIGYSIIIDAIVGEAMAEYEVMYIVAQLGRGYEPKIMPLIYTKNLMNRLDWFLSLGMDIERLERMAELNSYPMRGSACLHYNRPCKYFNTCSLHSLDFPKELEEDENEYDFHFDLQGLIDSHIGRIGKVNVI